MTKTLRSLFVLMTICLLPLAAMAQTTYYVTTDATVAGDGSSWNNPMTLTDALNTAKAKDQIWVQAGTYTAPVAGFTLRSGVSLYGGFAGTESSIDDRAIDSDKAYRMTHQTILSGDVNKDDKVDGVNLIFPANQYRDDNATHVLTINLAPTEQSGNNNTERTIVDGITIKGGHADGVSEQGGGILVEGNNSKGGVYIIRRCFFIENYATQGGALYVTGDVTNTANECLIDRCGFFNNAAGQRGTAVNEGGAIYLAGAGTVVNCAVFNNENGGIYLANNQAKVINSTVTRNTASGIDGGDNTPVYNTVIWGNSTLSSDNHRPAFNHCAYPEANPGSRDADGNVYLAAKNNEENGPHFSSPSLKTGFDTDFQLSDNNRYPLWTWEPMEATPLVDMGNKGVYDITDYDNVDLNGDPRIQGNTIDIGAFEYQPVSSSRIRYVKQGGTGDGTSWENASGDLQRMIDELADNNPQGLQGEVWVAAGTYEPQSQLIQGSSYSASFRMRDGISVYGGFIGGENSKTEREKKEGGMPWEFQNQTVLMAAYYVRNESNPSFTDHNHKWTLTSDSRHVVWFAPMPDEEGTFTQPTYLDGVTITGGYAQSGTGLEDFKTDRGAGVYMDGRNTYLTNSIVKENYATGNGGGVYLKDGRVQSTLIYNNNADQNGGAVYVDDRGLVHRSMLANNSARNGAGVYLDNQQPTDGEEDHPEYLILSTCVVSNNTASGNGAVYCDEGGVLLQNTITNNRCVTATDATDPNASQTGGIYINRYALVANSVIWNNRMSDGTNIPMYAKNPTADKVRFMYNAISGVNNAVWNNTLQEQTLSLVDQNAGTTDDPNSIGPRFEEPTGFDINTAFGVQADWRDAEEKADVITYFWKPVNGSNLWARGMALGQLPSEVVLAPEIDIAGELFAQKPAVGAFHVDKSNIVPALEGNTLVVYIDADCTEPDHYGSSWGTAYRSLNDAISYFAKLKKGDGTIDVVDGSGNPSKLDLKHLDTFSFEIRVLEGSLWPRYAFVNEDPKTATLDILAMQSDKPLKIVGGYYRNEGSNDDVRRDPLNHRSQLNGNPDGDSLDDGLYHVVTVESDAQVELDGFHVINGYAAGTATLQYGAGMLVHDNAEVTLTNCIFENNTAVTGAAIYAQGATLTLQNCVVNNNTNTTEANPVIVADNPTLQHVTVVNNQGAAPGNMGTTSFSAGNTSGTNSLSIATTSKTGAANFANPTNGTGATLGFNTYLGGYASFRPLTSSSDAGNSIINKVSSETTTLSTDITVINERDLGGMPDLGAYEAELPKSGRVYYVRTNGSDSNDGLSWDKAFATVRKAVETANKGEVVDGEKPQVWVAAGTYEQSPQRNSDNCFEILDGVNVYGAFPKTGNPSMDDRHPLISQYIYNVNGGIQPKDYETILTPSINSGNRRVLGQEDEYNPINTANLEQVAQGEGDYSFTNVGSGNGNYERVTNDGYYETSSGATHKSVRELRTETIRNGWSSTTYVEVGNGYGDYNLEASWFGGMSANHVGDNQGSWVQSTGADYYEVNPNLNPTHAYFTAGQYREVNDNQGSYSLTEVGPGNGDYIVTNRFTYETAWDGFTLYNGYLDSNTLAYLTDNAKRNGGAGAAIFTNVTLRNSIITNNTNSSSNTGTELRGGGVYCDEGTLINCYVVENKLGQPNQYTAYGGGCYMYRGTAYNCVISENETLGQYTDGAGIFIENAEFYNNTIVKNTSHGTTRGNGGISLYNTDGSDYQSRLVIYNCIVLGNTGFMGMTGNADIAIGNRGVIECNYSITSSNQNVVNGQNAIYYNNTEIRNTSIFTDYTNNNYRLGSMEGVNMGIDEPVVNGNTILLADYTDMDFTDRIKDCRVDAGAYERNNVDNVEPEPNQTGRYVYYVTQNGAGSMTANSLANAACAMKLQTVLNAAGIYKAAHPGYEVVVKVAGYNGENSTGFIYHANTLANENDPQSYSYTVPYGVVLEGGYSDDDDNWNDAGSRNAIAYPTKLSAIYEGTSTTQPVNGYHVVTFGEKPDGWTGADTQTIIDGVWLIDGSATSMAGAGNSNTQGGGAIVPAWGHVRNCVVQGNTAIEGGGLYLLPGATVSGTAILDNTADNGGGVYADNTGITENTLSHIISCTIADNTADDGGGLFLKDGASMQVNTVIWGNEAPSNKNVSGVTGTRYADTQLASVFGNMNNGAFYPFNDCFVESQEMPSDFENASMQSDSTVYFADELRTLKEFSPLIKHGVANNYYDHETTSTADFLSVFQVAESDMQGISRVQRDNGAERVDAGAFAFEGGILPTDLFTRIFVSQAENVKLQDGENMLDYLGKSFYTAFSTLEDALAYVRSMRETSKATDDTEFEILVSSGTYKPIYKRGDDESSPTVANDQRLYSFVVPHGVSIYGGFSGTEKYITPVDMQFPENDNDKVISIPSDEVSDVNDGTTPMTEILSTRKPSDFNGNGIKEPWELANQTILSGNINVSAEVGNVYHVLYTNASGVANPKPVLLDGLTVMDGETFNELSNVNDNDEAGRGGGLYSNGVGYTINRCRFMNNLGLRGGAVYVRDARLNVVGSIFAGNGWTDASATTPPNQPARGGAIFIGGSRNGSPVSLYAINSLFVNNETIGDGGAIGTTFAEGITSYVDPMLDIMNCTFAKNKAKMNAVVYNHNGKSHLTNTLIWGNESESYNENTDAAHMQISHSASDYDYGKLFSAGDGMNILLDGKNTASNGPRFTRPSAKAGIAGNDATCHWNPSGISVTTDKGDGVFKVNAKTAEGAYDDWFVNPLDIYKDQYMAEGYERYSGPLDETTGQTGDKPIDIGVYEYQYISNFQTMTAIYVATEESGDHSGRDWANATSDLRGAIVGASHPSKEHGNRTIYVRDGEYALERLSGGTAFTASVDDNEWSKGLTIKGACTGIGLEEDAQQDFANQSVIRNHEGTTTTNLMAVHVNGDQYVRIEGFTFVNKSTSGTGIDASTNGTSSKFTLANSALRMNNTGVNISASSGSILIYNTLFADGGTGLKAAASGNVTLVNTTFANDSTADMSEGLANVYNSVSWNNGTQHMAETDHNNKVFAANTDNADIENGPNFVDPLNDDVEARDYHIRPSLTLLNQGNNQHYEDNVLGGNSTATLADERDLGNSARLTDGTIDIGAYEYEAPLQPVVYVKAGLVNYENNDGSSWTKALEDLQGAIDLVGIYAHNHVGENGYVFVSGNVTYTNQVRVSLPNVKVYGGMNDETSDIDYKNEDGSIDTGKVNSLVNDLLAKRKGLLEGTRFSTLAGNTTINADGSVLDGFMVTGTPAINNGCLSSSIVNNTDGVTGEANGILYNTLVYGDVNRVKAVNVTATGSIDNVNENANNRANVTETNAYVATDHWKYQLMETSTDIDGGTEQNIQPYTKMVGHNRDIAGNKRIRNTVDNGCFETWNITPDMTEGNNIVTEEDYPHDQSVVYVRKGNDENPESAELVIEKKYTASEPFNPGVLLLEHHAGMRVDYGEADNNVGLSYVIMERDVPASGADMAYAPFSATIENNGVSLKYYDAAARAAYGYNKKDNGAWANFTGTYNGGYGLLLDNTQGSADAHVRFVGNSGNRNSYVYREGEGMNAPKQVSLKKENHSDPWTVDNPGTSNKFTAKENMSWNLFGSPYLCAMNYEDMEYGRVIYGYQNGTYMTVNTDAENTTHEGYIPAGDAIFTQTATLKDKETFAVDPRGSEKSGEAYGSMAAVKLSITHMDNARAAEGIAAGGDVLQLNTVTPEQARDDFDMGADGVKWMADSVAQIYALQGGSRYSLLSAVNVEGKVSVGVTLPAPGLYTIQVPEDCLAEGYETIVLEDANTGKAVNLLEGGYDFSSATAGDIKGRFSISFNRMADDRQDDGIRAYSLSRGTIRVEGVAVGDRVSVYRTDGIMAGQGIASSTTEDVSANVSTVAIVKVERDGKTIAVKKIRVD